MAAPPVWSERRRLDQLPAAGAALPPAAAKKQ
jgi:hypothetical protein